MRVTASIDSSYAGPASDLAKRVIAASGITANIVAGIVTLMVRKRVSPSCRTCRFFLWFYGHLTLFMGTSYLAGFAFLPFGDVHGFVNGLPFQGVISFIMLVAGVVGYRESLLDAERTNETGLADVTPAFIATGLVAVTSALSNPLGPVNGALWAAAATFGAGYGVIAAAADRAKFSEPAAAMAATGAGGWHVGAGIALVAMFFVLGPGVPR